jgi:hypothetical protein
MTAGRRPLVIALAVALAAIVVLLVLLITGGGDSNNSPGARSMPTASADSRAADRAEIQRVAEAWRKALNPKSSDNPCRYMTAEAADQVQFLADPRVRARGCTAAVRAAEPQGASVPLYQALQPGVQNIRFSPRVDTATGPAPGAEAEWRGDPGRIVTFVEDNGQWLIAK